MKRGLTVGTGGEACDRNLTTVHSDSAVTEAGPQREDDTVIPGAPAGPLDSSVSQFAFFSSSICFLHLSVCNLCLWREGAHFLQAKRGLQPF